MNFPVSRHRTWLNKIPGKFSEIYCGIIIKHTRVWGKIEMHSEHIFGLAGLSNGSEFQS